MLQRSTVTPNRVVEPFNTARSYRSGCCKKSNVSLVVLLARSECRKRFLLDAPVFRHLQHKNNSSAHARTHTHTHARAGGGGFCPTFRTKETLKNEVSTVVPSNGGRTYQILFCSVQRHELFFFLKFPCCTEVDQLVEDSVKPHKKYIWRVYFQKQTLMDNTLSARQNHVIIVANYLPSS